MLIIQMNEGKHSIEYGCYATDEKNMDLCLKYLYGGGNDVMGVTPEDVFYSVGVSAWFSSVEVEHVRDNSIEEFIDKISKRQEDRVGGVIIQIVGNITLKEVNQLISRFEEKMSWCELQAAYSINEEFAEGSCVVGVYM